MASGTPFSFTIPVSTPYSDFDEEEGEIDGVSSLTHQELCRVHKPKSETSSVNSFIPQSVLLGSLLEHLCSLYESNPQKSKMLFQAMCKQLEKINIVSPITYLDEYASIRSQYKSSFYDLIQSVLVNLDSPMLLSSNSNETINKRLLKSHNSVPLTQIFNLKKSRYEDEFEEMLEIGKGAFGKVFKARHKIDNQEYAVKKIKFKDVKTDEEPQIDKILREVQSLASLQHPHIVRYHNAWMEHHSAETYSDSDVNSEDSLSSNKRTFPSNALPAVSNVHEFSSGEPVFDRYSSVSNSNSSWGQYTGNETNESQNRSKFWKIDDTDDEDLASISGDKMSGKNKLIDKKIKIQFEGNASSPPSDVILTEGVRLNTTMKRVRSVILKTSDLHHGQFLQNRSNNITPVLRSQSLSNMRDADVLNGIYSKVRVPPALVSLSQVVLYVQMQICESSLQKWLLDRNTSIETLPDPVSGIDEIQSFDIFHQLLCALDYIHRKRILHRDLKPRNILLNYSRPHLLLGDFGLARPAISRDSSEVLTPVKEIPLCFEVDEHTSGVGTTVYAAPEQLNHDNYDFKADMYSAGIIFFELTWPFHTGHERCDLISNLRQGIIPVEYTNKWEGVAGVLQSLLSHDPSRRPSAEELLKKPFFSSQHGRIISDLKEENTKLAKENSDLKLLVEKYRAKFFELGINPDM